MRRREFIALLSGAAAWPLAARAQPADRVRLVGILTTVDDTDSDELIAMFQQTLEKVGWTEGRNLRFEQRAMLGDVAQAQAQTKDLLALSPDVILTNSNLSTVAVARQTKTIPIVFATAGDPIGTGLVANMAHPGGNVTGFAAYEVAIAGKWLELLKEVAPHVRRVAVIYTPEGAGSVGLMRTAKALAPSLGMQTTSIPALDASEMDRAIDAFSLGDDGGIVVTPGPTTYLHRVRIVAAAARHRLPAIHPGRDRVVAGGLMSYLADRFSQYQRAATYVDRILRGEKAGDLPVQLPSKFELVINLKAAKLIGIDIPPTLLTRADEVIE